MGAASGGQMNAFDPFMIDLDAARRFFGVMCDGGEAITFQTFDDSPAKRGHLASILHGDIDQRAEQLAALNAEGAGIFWMVNYGDGQGRRAANVLGVRAVFVDLDGAPLEPIINAPAEPHAIIESSPGKYHAYWLVDGCTLDQFKPAQVALARKYGADQSVNDPPRVMRVPGFAHQKGVAFTSRIIQLSQFQPYQFGDLMQRLGVTSQVETVTHAPDHVTRQQSGVAQRIPEGGRNVYLTRVVGRLNSMGLHPAAIRQAVEAENRAACDPPLPDGELQALVSECLRRYVIEHGQSPVVSFGVGGMPASGTIPLLDIPALERACQAATWLVKGIVPSGSIGMMFGASGTFKSFLALDMALHVAHGMQWLGRKTKSGPVVFVAAEGGAGVWRRVQAWHKRHGIKPRADLPFYVLPLALDLRENSDAVVEAINLLRIQPVLVLVDTMAQTFVGEENSAGEVGQYLSALRTSFCATFGSTCMPVHHSGHNATERPRGSSANRANVDFLIGVHRDEKQMLATMSCSKQKDGEEFEDVTFALTSHELGFDEDGDTVMSLAACAVMDDSEKAELVRREASKGRSGRNASLLELAHNGMDEKDLRAAFIDTIEGDANTRRTAWKRAKDWATKSGLIEFVNGTVLIPQA